MSDQSTGMEKRVADLEIGDRIIVAGQAITVRGKRRGFARYDDGKTGVLITFAPKIDGSDWSQPHPDDMVTLG